MTRMFHPPSAGRIAQEFSGLQVPDRVILPPSRREQEPMAVLPGKRLGPYEILSAIGAGA